MHSNCPAVIDAKCTQLLITLKPGEISKVKADQRPIALAGALLMGHVDVLSCSMCHANITPWLVGLMGQCMTRNLFTGRCLWWTAAHGTRP